MKTVKYFLIAFFLGICTLGIQAQSFEEVNNKTSISEDHLDINFYPNPVKSGDAISVELELVTGTEMTTEVVDALGHKVIELVAMYPEGRSRLHISTADMEPGLYFIRLTTDQAFQREKVIIQ